MPDSPEAKTRAARNGVVISILGFVLGGFLACTCPWLFAVAGIFALAGLLWGRPLVRILAGLLVVLNFTAAVCQLRREVAAESAKQRAIQAIRQKKDLQKQP
jgi:predicted lipid-binding transport protein (Tim44 family)